MDDLAPTDEQVEAVRLAMTGGHLAINAGAGCGKSSTLRLIAAAKDEGRVGRGVYVAFNKRVVVDATGTFPRSVRCSTAHGLAMRAVGSTYAHKLNRPRVKSGAIASAMGIQAMFIDTAFGRKRLAPGFLAGILMRSVNRFCQTADETPTWRHIVTPQTMRDDIALMRQWDVVRQQLEPSLRKAWADMLAAEGKLSISHDVYLKSWSLLHPRLECDYLLSDEAQDLWPSWLSIMEDQRDHCQLVIVGDEAQELYQWRSSVNAMEVTTVDHRAMLTRSFRFGPEIASVANATLARMGSSLRLTGGGPSGRVGWIDFPDMILCRTNAQTVRHALEELGDGGKPHIVGGATEVVSFARGALDLQTDGYSYHPDLCCFGSWSEVVEYAEHDEMGGELALLVSLVEDFGAATITGAFTSMPDPEDASLIVSTVHKMKGGESPSVKLADDFPSDEDPARPLSEEELKVGYVAVTRAQRELDVSGVSWLAERARVNPPPPLALPLGTVDG